ncbi:MAG: tripartite tricarboxylate transporter substrate binding protein [Betaproteobacteria bacterium]|nr:tripartite tricarboxylate transporter substrate binding protein [Betaproteobacteria bacterium]
MQPKKMQAKRNLFIDCGLALATGLAMVTSSQAQEWPQKPVRIVIPFAPGGAADLLARILSEKLSQRMGGQFITENRAGAGGMIGSEVVAKSAPDGYNLVLSGIGSHVVAPAAAKTPYDPLRDFTHIALFGGFPAVLLVHAGSPSKTLKEFIEQARANGGVAFGTPGHGTHAHLIGVLLGQKAKVTLTPVPYKGGGPALADLSGNQVPSAFVTLGAAAPHIRAGKLRSLGLTTVKRLPDFPDMPTFGEGGFPDLVAITWYGLSGPAGLARPLATRLNQEVRGALKEAEVRERLRPDGIEPNELDVDAFTAFVRAEIERWGPIAKGTE